MMTLSIELGWAIVDWEWNGCELYCLCIEVAEGVLREWLHVGKGRGARRSWM